MGWLDDTFGDVSGDDWLNFGGSLVNAWMGADAAKDAAKAQGKATDKANAQTWKMYQQTRQDQMPWLTQGSAAVNQLGYLLGLTGGPSASTPTPATPTTNPNQDKGRTYDKIRKLGAWGSLGGQDTITAHINPREALQLFAQGGSGRIDPVTGYPHFEENDDNAGYDADGGGGWRDGSGNHHSGAMDGGPGRDTFGANYAAMGRAYNNWKNQKPEFDMGWKDWLGVGGALLSGNPVGLRGVAQKGLKYGMDMANWNNAAPYGSRVRGGVGGPGRRSAGESGNDWLSITSPRQAGDSWGGGSSGGYGTSTGSGITANNINGPTTNPANATTGTANDGLWGSWMKDFGMADYQADPGYAFRMQQANDALEKSAAAKGTLFSGQFLKDMANYNSGLASQEYGNAYDRYMNNRSSKYNMLAGLAGLGQTSAGTLGSLGNNAATNMGNAWMSLGDAQAASKLAQSNAWQGGINNALNYWNSLNY